MNLYDKIKPYIKHIEIVALLCSTGLIIAHNVSKTRKNINKIINTNVLDREKKFVPEYIYINDPSYSFTLEEQRPKEKKKYIGLPRFMKHLKRSLEWKLLWLCRHGNREQRNLALDQLAAFKNNKVWDYYRIGQALDKNTAVLLARTKGADERYFLPPPLHVRKSAKTTELASFKLKEIILVLQASNPHSCIQRFLSKYFANVQEQVMEADHIPSKPDSVSERELCMLCLDALHHHLTLLESEPNESGISPSQLLVKVGLLPLLAEIFLRNQSDPEMDFAILHILTILSVHTELLTGFFENGLIGELARLLHSSDIRLSSSAAVCLTNLSGEGCYRPGLFLLHPIYRTSQPYTCDTLLVHGLRGDVFVTWRQRDRKCTKVTKEKALDDFCAPPTADKVNIGKYMADPELEQVMEDLIKLQDESLLSDFEVVLHDLPVAGKRDPSSEYEYMAQLKRGALVGEIEDNESYTYCWPKDWLPKDCDNLRIIGVNYWTSLSEWLGRCPLQIADIAMRAQNLLPALCDAGVGIKNIPVVWLAHSMGGLIVKQILVESVQSKDPVDRKISKNTQAVLFFSTPHRGSALATMPRAAAAILWPSTDVRQLQVNSPVLLELHKLFLKLAEERNWETICFSETEPTLVTAFKVPVHFVEPSSADLGRGVFYELPLDHFSICKPATRQSVLYTTVVNVIQRAMLLSTKVEQRQTIIEWLLEVWGNILKKITRKLTKPNDESSAYDDFYIIDKALIEAFAEGFIY